MKNYDLYIKSAADSISVLRKCDVFRVIDELRSDNIHGVTKPALGDWIARNRPDLAQEVKDILDEIQEDTQVASRVENGIPETVKRKIAFHRNLVIDYYRTLDGVQVARGSGHILALELERLMPEIKHSISQLVAIQLLAVNNGVGMEFFEILSLQSIPDLTKVGYPKESLPAWFCDQQSLLT